MKSLKIIFATTECAPFSKAGGLGDVGIALPKALLKLGHDVSVITPLYGFIDKENFSIEAIERNVDCFFGQENLPFTIRKTITGVNTKLPVYFIDHKDYFSNHKKIYGYDFDNERFLFFCKAILETCKKLQIKPDIIHCNDWQIGIIPQYLKTEYKYEPLFQKTATIFTIHNLAMQGTCPNRTKDDAQLPPPQDIHQAIDLNPTKRGILYADLLNAVSETYREEILTPEQGEGLDKYLIKRKDELFGITNGVDYEIFNPALDKTIKANYDINSLDKKVKNKLALQKEFDLKISAETPTIGMIHRITEQKGFDLILEILDSLLKKNVQLIISGSGDEKYIKAFKKYRIKCPEKFGFYPKFSTEMQGKIFAGSDFFLMPSRFEPCGLPHLFSLRYGTIPIVRSIGGLADTIEDFDPKTFQGNGFVFHGFNKLELFGAIIRALETYKYEHIWQNLIRKAMAQSFTWEIPAQKYVKLYKKALVKIRLLNLNHES